MSLPELATPIRIYWDLTPLPESPPDLARIAAEIIDLKILNVDMTATGGSIPPACLAAVASLAHSRIAVTLTVSPAPLSAAFFDALATAPPRELLVEIGSQAELDRLRPLPPEVAGISFPVNDNNWQQLPQIITCCADNGIRRLVLPMQRLYHGEQPFHVPKQGLETIAAALASFRPAPEMRTTAHDPFVWRAIFPHTPFPEGRCQAANTMLSIDSSGIVYPCPVMPVALGDLRTTPLKEIAKGDAKKKLRAELLRLPRGCADCADAAACKGGCRGRGERTFGNWDSIDPGCC
jgi:GeoRSP system SPASM domain protein